MVIAKSLSKIPLILVKEVLIAAKTFVFLSVSLASVPSRKNPEYSAVVATARRYLLKYPSLVLRDISDTLFLISSIVWHSKFDSSLISFLEKEIYFSFFKLDGFIRIVALLLLEIEALNPCEGE